jgi:hypothetical protein
MKQVLLNSNFFHLFNHKEPKKTKGFIKKIGDMIPLSEYFFKITTNYHFFAVRRNGCGRHRFGISENTNMPFILLLLLIVLRVCWIKSKSKSKSKKNDIAGILVNSISLMGILGNADGSSETLRNDDKPGPRI